MALTGTNWLGNPKDVNEEALTKLSSFFQLGKEIELSSIDEMTKALCFYEYGPALSLLELETFMNELTGKISKFRVHREELFYQMFNAICFSDDTNFIVRNCLILVFDPPTCVVLKFGEMKTVKFVIHLKNHALYILGEDTEPIPFLKSSSQMLEQKYRDLSAKIAQKVGSMVLEKLTKFEAYLTEGSADSLIAVNEHVKATNKGEQVVAGASREIKITYDQLSATRKETKDVLGELHTLMLTDSSAGAPKKNKRDEFLEKHTSS